MSLTIAFVIAYAGVDEAIHIHEPAEGEHQQTEELSIGREMRLDPVSHALEDFQRNGDVPARVYPEMKLTEKGARDHR